MIDPARAVRDWHEDSPYDAVCILCREPFKLVKHRGRRAYGGYCESCHSKYMRSHKLRQYGLTPEDFLNMVAAQENKCAICRKEMEPGAFRIDHDHQTGKVRALLCANCNSGLGLFYENVDALQNAIAYLRKHSRRT